jgi:hypothetical protein
MRQSSRTCASSRVRVGLRSCREARTERFLHLSAQEPGLNVDGFVRGSERAVGLRVRATRAYPKASNSPTAELHFGVRERSTSLDRDDRRRVLGEITTRRRGSSRPPDVELRSEWLPRNHFRSSERALPASAEESISARAASLYIDRACCPCPSGPPSRTVPPIACAASTARTAAGLAAERCLRSWESGGSQTTSGDLACPAPRVGCR